MGTVNRWVMQDTHVGSVKFAEKTKGIFVAQSLELKQSNNNLELQRQAEQKK